MYSPVFDTINFRIFRLTLSFYCMKSFFLFRLLPVLTLIMAVSEIVMAQGDPGSGGPTPGVSPTAIPLDGGVSLLLAGGVAYGIKHLRNRRKKV